MCSTLFDICLQRQERHSIKSLACGPRKRPNDHARNELKHCLDRVCARAWTQLGVREGHGWWWRAAGHRRAFLSPYMSYQPAAAFAPAPTAYLTSHCQWQAHLDGTVQLVAFYSRTVAGGCCCSSSC